MKTVNTKEMLSPAKLNNADSRITVDAVIHVVIIITRKMWFPANHGLDATVAHHACGSKGSFSPSLFSLIAGTKGFVSPSSGTTVECLGLRQLRIPRHKRSSHFQFKQEFS